MEAGMEITIPDKLYFRIGEVSRLVGVEAHVLRYWESEFNIVKPSRTRAKQRLYKREDVELILEIKKLLYKDRFTIKGAKKALKELKGAGARQPSSTLLEGKYLSAINQVKKDLMEIKDILS
jgi:DNA-binding transcriptional MerR regulator